MKFIAIIQARLSSHRFPRKVITPLNPISNSPLVLEYLIQRVSRIKQVDKIIIAVPEDERSSFQKMLLPDFVCITGGEKYDVLHRFLEASGDAGSNDYIVRITADNPFLDYKILKKNISFVKKHNPDYSYPAWLPLGMGFEICAVRVLKQLNECELSPSHREHVTTYIKENPAKYTIQPMQLDQSQYPFHENIRLTIDEPDDLILVQKVYAHFADKDMYFCATEINKLYESKSEFFVGNQHIHQKSQGLSEVV